MFYRNNLLVTCFFIVVGLILPTSSFAVQVVSAPTNGLIGYWSFEEGVGTTAYDYSGKKNNGVFSPTPPTWANGRVGKAMNFNGSSNFVQIDNSSLFDVADFTYSAWIYAKNTTNWRSIIDIDNDEQLLAVYNGKIGIYGRCGNKTGYGNIAVNSWNHLIWVVSGSSFEIYLNGVMVGSGTGSCFPSVNADRLMIGAGHPGNEYFNGLIDEVRVYNRALSSTEIAAVYNSGSAKINSQKTINKNGLDAGLVGYWTMDNQDIYWLSNSIRDRSGNNNNGTFNGMSMTTAPVAGKLGQAIMFDGVDDYIITTNMRNNFNDETVTISVWFKANGAGIVVDELGQTAINTNWHDSQIEVLATGEVKVRVWNLTAVSLGIASFGKWHHAILRYNKATNKLDGFLNGVKSASEVSGDRMAPWESGYGMYYAFGVTDTTKLGGGAYFNGLIDDVRIYNRALSDSEAKQLYNQGSGTKINSAPALKSSGLDSGLLGYWTMDNQNINWRTRTMIDKSGNNNSGLLVSLATTTAPVAGKIGQALKFNGSSDYVSISDSSSLDVSRSMD